MSVEFLKGTMLVPEIASRTKFTEILAIEATTVLSLVVFIGLKLFLLSRIKVCIFICHPVGFIKFFMTVR